MCTIETSIFFLKELQFAQRKIDLNIPVNVKLILICFQCTCYHLNSMRDLSIRLFLLSIRNQVLLRNMKSPQDFIGIKQMSANSMISGPNQMSHK